MDANEIKDALLKQYPVEHNGIKYDYVSGVIYRRAEKGITVTVELMDKRGNSVTIVPVSKVKKSEV